MSWTAVIIGGASLAGGALSSRAAGKAADAQGKAGDAAIAEQRRQFDTLLGLNAPAQYVGNQALNALAVSQGYSPYSEATTDQRQVGSRVFKPSELGHFLGQGMSIDDILKLGVFESGAKTSDIGWLMKTYGLTPDDISRLQSGTFSPFVAPEGSGGGAASSGGFFTSPDYQFTRDEGLKAVQNSAAGAGGLYSGNALRGVTDYASGLASQQYGNWFNRNAALAGIGQTANSQVGNAAMQTGANVGNLLAMQGDARASGIMGQSNSLSNTANQLAQLYGMYQGGYFDKNRGTGWV